uniref:P-type ATPase N-terminal domain-containing protein n=1 Tax=Hucho hucho TaxID=62062 RepID=A0A4W5RH42_9TELE
MGSHWLLNVWVHDFFYSHTFSLFLCPSLPSYLPSLPSSLLQTNAIKTSKYNAFTFLPLNLFEQFQRIANAYFLILLLLQVIPAISSLSWFTTVVPLVLVLSVTAAKDATDDIVSIHIRESCIWALPTLLTCHILLLLSPSPFQADIFSTNLKVKQALTVTGDMGDNIHSLAAFNGELHSDGPETKLMQNCGKTTFKRTSIDRLMNVLVLCIFGFLAFMCTILAIGNRIWEQRWGSEFTAFLPRQDGVDTPFSSFLTFWSYVIILNTVVPISLYVSVEVIRLGNSFYIDWDRKMYHARSDTPAKARTTTLNEELGQIKYIFSDKTGTLTQNIMIFNKCSINGKCYGEDLMVTRKGYGEVQMV